MAQFYSEMIQIHFVESMDSQTRLCDGAPYSLPPFQILEKVTICPKCHVRAYQYMNPRRPN